MFPDSPACELHAPLIYISASQSTSMLFSVLLMAASRRASCSGYIGRYVIGAWQLVFWVSASDISADSSFVRFSGASAGLITCKYYEVMEPRNL